MKQDGLYYVAAAAMVAVWATTPASTETRQNLNINFPEGATSCADVTARSDGKIARTAETFTVSRSQAPTLEVSGLDRGQIRASGWDRPDYSVEACKIAAANTQADADQLLKGVQTSHSGGKFSASGPSSGEWQVIYIVRAPKDAALDFETRNGPISASSISGSLKARAANGPIAVRDCSGTIDVHTDNGPISWTGGSGDVQLTANNGPISVKLASDNWNGSRLEARTTNGPLSAAVPNGFKTAMRVEAMQYAPISCRLDACSNVRTDATGNRRVLELNGSNATVRLSTGNGPISLGQGSGGKRVRVI